jgi:capsid protein
MLFRGEKIGTVTARPSSNFRDFERAVLNGASGTGMAPCSSATTGLTPTILQRAVRCWMEDHEPARQQCDRLRDAVRMGWLEEAMEIDDLVASQCTRLRRSRAAYTRPTCGPGRGWIDPVANVRARSSAWTAGLSTLENECAKMPAQTGASMSTSGRWKLQPSANATFRARMGRPDPCRAH